MSLIRRVARPVGVVRPRASRRLLLSVAALAVGGLLPATASAAPEPGVLVIEGQGGTTTEWVVTGNAVFVTPERVQLTGGGAYAGVLIEPIDNDRSWDLGALQVRAFNDATRDVVAFLGNDGAIEPGRYRVTLFGQGAVSARYPKGEGTPGVRVVPRTRLPVTFLGRAETLDLGFDSARVELPGALPAGRRALQVDLSDGVEAGQREMCATRSQACQEPLLPLCLPSPAPCDPSPVSRPSVGATRGQPQIAVRMHRPEPTPRTLLWSFDGYRDTPGKLRAAAIVF